MSDELCRLTLTEVADGIRQKRFSSLEVTEACLDRTARHQELNAFITLDPEAARAAARVADAALSQAGPGGVLHGVPLAHKDMFYRAGRISTCGSRIRQDVVADRTATVLNRLDAAGALELGTLSMAEFAAGATGHNATFGNCLNPWDHQHTPGGSSTGSAVGLAARLFYGALGSDTGGSVRLPAYFCGVAGLRPTYGRVSRYGIMPRSWSADAVGPLARTVRDLARLLGVIAGPDPADPSAAEVAVPDYEADLEAPLKGRRIGTATNFFHDNIGPEMQVLLSQSLEVFRGLGADIVELAVPDPERWFAQAQIILKSEAAALHQRWIQERPGDYSEGIRSEMEAGLFIPAALYLNALRSRGPALDEFLDQVFSQVDLLHTPVYEYATPTMAACNPEQADGAAHVMATFGRLTRPFSYLGLPALVVPGGFLDGLPSGFQLVGRPFAEALVLNAGHLYQRETEWHRQVPEGSGS
ncbi:MAG: amidase [Alphaproteobacteria bacterium]|jgi:aspartyl-tRNA(Asn)/glutamyl-tRNA(Gln) amidotransferase subunit A|nr:amidase [Alphaproteobacteria bacterium]MDP7427947.1 amidase [Alphaproteobacteria bacterium]HJP22836.1 amidase [Alphaproteobacteria bacterium]